VSGKGKLNMKRVEDLDVFKLSHSLALEIFELTKDFPEEEKFGLISQMRRAAYSIPMNINGGCSPLKSKRIPTIRWDC
jgi:four helix bundle protein